MSGCACASAAAAEAANEQQMPSFHVCRLPRPAMHAAKLEQWSNCALCSGQLLDIAARQFGSCAGGLPLSSACRSRTCCSFGRPPAARLLQASGGRSQQCGGAGLLAAAAAC